MSLRAPRKGENYELSVDLNSEYREKRKDAIKRVIASMTVGKDVSGLFPDVLKNMQTDDLEQKKLVYLYLMNYAKTQPELVILAVNTFVKDTDDPNPLVRALAIRTMGVLRAEKIIDYLCDPLQKCLRDENPYVRKTAALCVAKLYDLKPDLVLDNVNGGVVLAAVKVIMIHMRNVHREDLIKQLVRKMAPPLVTLLFSPPEVQWVALRNINLLLQKRPDILQNEMRVFFCKYNDPLYVKVEKLDIMVTLAGDNNVDALLSELKEYSSEVDVDFVRKSIKAIGQTAVKIDSAAERCVVNIREPELGKQPL
ncbi:ARM repeat-containing protein [Dendrothele bispora CBS 962.96]|uniref:ARM repeat-containing protein n=1 Tax=Dendrothele bispora (strain CBS 962.96) TaxID=1314807 RepID=A0A4S8MKT4_DENBC|nr:ARM repeat-containing protein [Dendrothele bispora CBS 962.96]